MRSAPATRLMVLGCAMLLGAGLSACGNDGPSKVDAATDVAVDTAPTDATADRSGDARTDVPRVDLGQDLPGVDMPNLLCSGVAPTTNFSDPFVVADFDGLSGQTFNSTGTSPVAGGIYPGVSDPVVVSDFSGQNWHITASVGVGANVHFGIYWTCALPTTSGGCTLDISGFKGIRFKIKGNVGPDHAMTLSLGRAQNDVGGANAMCGSCVLPAGTDAGTDDYCRGPRVIYPVPDDGSERVVTLLWTDFSNGFPHDSIDPHQVTGILWLFHPLLPPLDSDGGTSGGDGGDASIDATSSDATSSDAISSDAIADGSTGGDASTSDAGDAGGGAPPASYAADITIDDIQLIPY